MNITEISTYAAILSTLFSVLRMIHDGWGIQRKLALVAASYQAVVATEAELPPEHTRRAVEARSALALMALDFARASTPHAVVDRLREFRKRGWIYKTFRLPDVAAVGPLGFIVALLHYYPLTALALMFFEFGRTQAVSAKTAWLFAALIGLAWLFRAVFWSAALRVYPDAAKDPSRVMVTQEFSGAERHR